MGVLYRNTPFHLDWLLLPVLIVWAAIVLAGAIATWQPVDITAYLGAATRLQHGAELYPAGFTTNASEAYRYAPWFAFVWIPLTWLPRDLVIIAWEGLLLGCVAYCAYRMRHHILWAMALIPALFIAAMYGNVQPLLVAAVVWSPSPAIVGLAASLKIAPLMLLSGDTRRFLLGAAITAGLWLPALWFGLENYPTSGGTLVPAPLWLHVALGLLIGALAWRYPSHRLLLGTIATIVILPRFHVYDASWLIVALAAGLPSRTLTHDPTDQNNAVDAVALGEGRSRV